MRLWLGTSIELLSELVWLAPEAFLNSCLFATIGRLLTSAVPDIFCCYSRVSFWTESILYWSRLEPITPGWPEAIIFLLLCFIVSNPSSLGSSILLVLWLTALVLTKTSLWPCDELSLSSPFSELVASSLSLELLLRNESSFSLALDYLEPTAILTSEYSEALAWD